MGVELAGSMALGKGFTAFGHYTFADYQYEEYLSAGNDLSGKSLPGLPRHLAYLELRYLHTKGWYGVLQGRQVGKLYADDANVVPVDGYFNLQFRAGMPFRLGKWTVEPFAGFNNLTGTEYYNNIRINAARSRYFEPAPGRTGFVGLRLSVLPG